MPKEISYILCDCEKGKLEEIAATSISWGTMCGDGGRQTSFYACDHCDMIYEQSRDIPGYHVGGRKEDTLFDMETYKGPLTKEELIKYAEDCFGNIYSYKEKEILEKRLEEPFDTIGTA